MILKLPLFILCEAVFSNSNKPSYLSDCCPKIFHVNKFFYDIYEYYCDNSEFSLSMNHALLYIMSY
jgi:hypothetical protein